MINFLQYLNQQMTEDKRAFIIFAPACSGKTVFARRAAGLRKDIDYLDLQYAFLKQSDLPPVKQCDFNFLKKYLLELKTPQEVILVDNADFLFNTWRDEEKQKLLQWIRIQLRAPGDSEKTFIFMIQTDDVLSAAQFNNSIGQARVLPLYEFEAI